VTELRSGRLGNWISIPRGVRHFCLLVLPENLKYISSFRWLFNNYFIATSLTGGNTVFLEMNFWAFFAAHIQGIHKRMVRF
jgi:hypothetical protein